MILHYYPLAHDFADRSVRESLKQTDNLRDFLLNAIPQIARDLDCSRAKQVDREFFLKGDWRKRESDLMFLIPYRDGDVERETLICILIEHQSQPDSRMPLRLLIYAALYWERQWSEWHALPKPRPDFCISPIVPIVLHTGEHPWTTHRCLADLFDGPEVFRQFAPNWPVKFWDLAEKPPQALLDAGGAWLKAMALIRAGDEDEETFREVMQAALVELERLADQSEVRWTDLLEFMLSWAIKLRPKEELDRLAAQVQASHQGARFSEDLKMRKESMATTLFREGEARGEARGKAIGEARGKAIGEIEGMLTSTRAMLMECIEARCESVPTELAEWIASESDVERLRAFYRRALKANSLDELGPPPSN